VQLIQSSPSVAREDVHATTYAFSVAELTFKVILRSSNVDDLHLIWMGWCNFLLVINSNLGPLSHHLATVHPWPTDRWQTTTGPQTHTA